MKKNNKGAIFASIIITIALYVFAIALVLVFFAFFKYHITIEILDEYRWNKVQEIPLSLFSMTLNGESFVSKANKVYYKKASENQLITETEDRISKQLFYYMGVQRPFTAIIDIIGIKIATKKIGCSVNSELIGGGEGGSSYACKCSANCAKPEGTQVGSTFSDNGEGCINFLSKCISTGNERVEISAKFPFPLTFNGTDKSIGSILYNITLPG